MTPEQVAQEEKEVYEAEFLMHKVRWKPRCLVAIPGTIDLQPLLHTATSLFADDQAAVFDLTAA